jgi:hypothetical protein
MELKLGRSGQVFARCTAIGTGTGTGAGRGTAPRGWTAMRAELTNANPHPVTLRLQLAPPGVVLRVPGRVVVKNGMQTVEVTLPANAARSFDWRLREDVGG